jgi:DNA-directed RNA polymerase III subunit RPC2
MAESLRAKAEASLHGQDEETKAALLGGPSLEAPIDTVADKWKLLPAFLKVRGLVKQHLDSYNHLIGIEMAQIVKANELVTCEADPNFYMRFLDVSLGEPSDQEFHNERTWQSDHFTPQECRLRDITYSAPIKVRRPVAWRRSAPIRASPSSGPGRIADPSSGLRRRLPCSSMSHARWLTSIQYP